MAENELTSVILSDLRAQREWQTTTGELLRQISERMARLENSLAVVTEQQRKQQEDVRELEALKNQSFGIKNLVGYLIASAPGLIALIQLLIH